MTTGMVLIVVGLVIAIVILAGLIVWLDKKEKYND
jgi:nitrogen fixation-related uncharacterized protein